MLADAIAARGVLKTVDFKDAEADLEALVESVAATGEGFVLTRDHKAIAQVLPLAKAGTRIGFMKGRVQIGEDMERASWDELRDLFES